MGVPVTVPLDNASVPASDTVEPGAATAGADSVIEDVVIEHRAFGPASWIALTSAPLSAR
jgi:hypothetical protein